MCVYFLIPIDKMEIDLFCIFSSNSLLLYISSVYITQFNFISFGVDILL